MSAVTEKKSAGQFWLLCALVGLTALLILPASGHDAVTRQDREFLWTNAAIGLVSGWMILVESRRARYSLKLMHWLFQYAFMFAAPRVQYLQGAFQDGPLSPSQVDLLHAANFLVLLWQGIWIVCTLGAPKPDPSLRPEHRALAEASGVRLFVLFSLSCLVLLYLRSFYGWDGLLTRGARSGSDPSSGRFIVSYAIRAVPVVLFASAWLKWREQRVLSNLLLVAASGALALLTNFPVSTGRFWFGAVALGLMVTLFRPAYRVVTYVILVGLNVLFPLLGGLRHITSLGGAQQFDFGRSFGGNLVTGDYDAYSMLCFTIEYVRDVGSSTGHQLLSSWLFFIPRAVWPGKGFGSGYTVGLHYDFGFLNVSSPLLAEGLINFGMLGLALFAAASALLARRLDQRYWEGGPWWLRDAYPFLLGFWFFMLRGDLLSTTAFTTAFLAVFMAASPRQRQAAESDPPPTSLAVSGGRWVGEPSRRRLRPSVRR